MEGEREVEEVIKQDELFFKNEEIFLPKKKKKCSSKSREVIPGYDLILPKQQNCYHPCM